MKTSVFVVALITTSSFAAPAIAAWGTRSEAKNLQIQPLKSTHEKVLPQKDIVPKTASNVLLDIDGSVFPLDQFPESCKDMLRGGKCDATPFGKYHVDSKKEGDLVHSVATFTAPEGVQVLEESWEKNGHVQKAFIENRALKKRSEIEVKDGKAFFKVTDLTDQSVKTGDMKADENLVVPSTVMSYIRPHHGELLAGKELQLRVAVLDRRDIFTFYIKKIRDEKTVDGESAMVLQMSAGSLIMKALVDPMLFFVNLKNGEMFAFEGKSALRRKDGDKYKEMNVRTAYRYKVNEFKLTEKPLLNSGAPCTDDMIKTGEMKCKIPSAADDEQTQSSSSSK